MMIARRLLRHAVFLWMTLASMATAQSFSEQVAGIYKTSPDFDFTIELILWPSDEGFAGDAFVAGARYPVYAEQDGPALRGIFDVDGTLQRFTFLPSKSGHVAVQFSGEPVPVAMTRTQMPEFAGLYSGSFGDLSLRQRGDQLLAEYTNADGETTIATASSQGLRVSIPDIAIALYYEIGQKTLYIDTPSFFGEVQPKALPLRVGAGERADYASLAQALEAAAPNDVIEIAPGTYQGPFNVTKSLSLRGSGPAEDIILQATGETTLHWTATGGDLSGVTVKAPEGGAAVQASGSLSLADTVVDAAPGGVGLRLSGDAEVTVTTTAFRGGDHAVETVDFNGTLTLDESELGRTEKSILSATSATPESRITIRDNQFSQSASNALRLDGVGNVIISGNVISDVRVALHHTGGQQVMVEGNGFSGIKAHAIWLEGPHKDTIVVRSNDFQDVGEACVLLNNLQFPTQGVLLSRNKMVSCQQFGVAVAGANTKPSGPGIGMLGETLIDSGTHVALYAPVRIAIQDATMQDARAAGLVVSDGVDMNLLSSAIANSGENGVVAIGDGISFTLNGTSVAGSGKSAVVLSGRLKAAFDNTTIADNNGHGIELHQGVAIGQFDRNDINGNTGAGVSVFGTVFTSGKDNRFMDNQAGEILRN